MNAPETNDPIEKLLREENVHVADDGFTRIVMDRVPRRRHRQFARSVLFAVVAVGSVLVIQWLPWRSLPPLDYTKVLALDSEVFSAWLPFVVVVAALASAAWAAVQSED